MRTVDDMHNNFNADEKILRYTNKLDYFFNGHKTLIVAELDLTNRCNNACPGCCGVNESGAELNQVQIDRIIKSLADIDCKGVILSGGGEPLISPFFIYTVERLRLHGIKVGLNSNGLALDNDKIDMILKHCEYFRISLDAASPEMYKKTHG
ncbi:MAG: radical SAM protein, partial [Treponema sp.]|nr:radical SAM protein [Treponema sp.]